MDHNSLITVQLYRYYNSSGDLLYVGISLDAVTRLAQHKEKAPWFTQIARIEIEHYESRKECAKAERLAIRREQPLHNKAFYDFLSDPDEPPGLSESSLAVYLRVEEKFVQNLRDTGEGPKWIVHEKEIRYLEGDVEEWLQSIR